MHEKIQAYAKRLKLSWVREHYQDIQADTREEFLLRLFEKEIEQREERKINLLLKSATLPKVSGKPFDWKEVRMGADLDQETLYNGKFIENQENVIFYGGVGAGKTYLSTLIGLNVIQHQGKRVKFYTVASLVNELLDANEKGTLSKVFKRIEKLDLLILDELCEALHNSSYGKSNIM
ncbi:ATP-binding protein [Bacillus piscicola]|uniref:ATP-binding protein n=1 Tax=Bacillus piscicola TaxID=1632684 RepID=UPI0030845B6C